MSENHYDLELEALKRRSVDRLLMADVLDMRAFEAFMDHLWNKAPGLRNESTISKQILGSIRSAASAIRSRAEYDAAVREHIRLADDFDLMLDLIIAGEIKEDRRAGIPRTK